jgi:hypothetical protein
MSSSRRWYERALGAALVLVGVVCVLPVALLWIWARHQYTVGLSVDWAHVLPVLAAVTIAFGGLFVLSGIALLRRP